MSVKQKPGETVRASEYPGGKRTTLWRLVGGSDLIQADVLCKVAMDVDSTTLSRAILG